MPTKINKVARDLNVGVGTAVEFLRKHKIEVDDNPNARISDEAVDLLTKEFSKDKASKSQSEQMTAARRVEKRPAKPERVRPAEDVKTAAPQGPQLKVVGRIDLPGQPKPQPKQSLKQEQKPAPKQEPKAEHKPEPKQHQPKPEPKAEVKAEAKPAQKQENKPAQKQEHKSAHKQAQKPAPKPEQKQTPKPEQKPAPKPEAPKKEEKTEERKPTEVFRYGGGAPAPQLKVVGTIDLNALNQTTRPKKKTKEERRKEHQAGAAGASGKRKRTRIGKEKVDVEKVGAQAAAEQNKSRQGQGDRNRQGGGDRQNQRQRGPKQRNNKPEVSAEDMQKQVRETLDRLTSKSLKKGAKWRKEKRDEMHNRELANQERAAAESKILKLTEFVTANDLASMMEIPVNQVIGTCMKIGVMVSINQRLDAETINIVAEEFGFTTEYVSADVSEAIATVEDSEEDLVSRPPIVTVMGHVDHGKTSLLDYIRKANVIAGEAGGITQHIGAYHVTLPDGRNITFLDTPGHEAFTAMRARGAKVTDLAIIIVAADDDVMPQTIEAINHASAAGVPMVFAINKIDKPTANPEKIKEALANMNYLVEDWGGKYQSQDISAKKGIGVEELMEKVLLEAEMLDLKANPNRAAIGSVIESSLDKGCGYVATVLVQNGTLRVGDVMLAGTHFGRIKAMFNERNQRVKEAGPATPVLVLGLNGAPTAGDTFNVLETEQEAREIAGKREQLQRELGLRTKKRPGLEELGRRRALNDFHELNLVVKGDVDGSVEALSDSLIKLSTPEVQVNVLHKGVGAISESDVTLAAASEAIIIGFQVRPSGAARREADKEGVEIRLYSVIYKAIEEVKDAMEGMLSPEIKEEITGTAEVLQTYHISKVGTIAGAMVRDGKIKRACKVRVIRDGIVIYTGDLGSLKRFKDDVKEVVSGYECGLSVAGYNDIREGDLIEGFEEVAVKKTL